MECVMNVLSIYYNEIDMEVDVGSLSIEDKMVHMIILIGDRITGGIPTYAPSSEGYL